ncbi:MAG TPA: MlaD family protein [Acidimicrobiales bacterium]|jgi:phospholipid/cholesterol/gamma-HCH transport system substrate-binding protein|nr:MlaD family protein [Acidimicrobiales bacterium]
MVRRTWVRAGGAVLVAVVMGTLLAACGGGTYSVTATFDDVGDLQKSGAVQVADVRVGRITGITLTDDFRAKVSMAITSSVHVPKNSEALVRTTSLLGEKFVELRPLGAPTQTPYLSNGDALTRTQQAPELEFVADSAIELLGAVNSSDVATIVQTGAEAFGGRGPELNRLLSDLSTISGTLASRTQQLTSILDNLDRGAQTLASGSGDIQTLLTNLATTSQILADNRQKAVNAVQQLSRLAAVQNDVLDKYHRNLDTQIKQVDAILAVAATQTQQLGTVVDFLNQFVYALPKAIPQDFTQVYMWAIPCQQDSRSAGHC